MIFKTVNGHDPVLTLKRKEYFREATEGRLSKSFPPQLRDYISFSEHAW